MNTKRFRALALLCVLSTAPGCIALALGAAGGAATVTYVKGNLTDSVNGSLADVRAAAVLTLEMRELTVRENRIDSTSAKLKSEYSDGKEIWITIEAVTRTRSDVTIRVGLTGDQRRSVRLLESIKANV